ncbi:S-layer homology domain-containing protein [Candidatus Peregrinibacteria bacterium]|nr:S-layer homology domain-containing protein [Candidatus Peregrinibacteria bacterium]
MKTLKRLLASLASLAVMANILVVPLAVAAGTYSDVPSDHWGIDFIEDLVEKGVLSKDNKTFRPDDKVARSELVKMAVSAFVGEIDSEVVGDVASFKDVPNTKDNWVFGWAEMALSYDIIKKAEYFRPTDPATRGEALKVLMEAAPIATDTDGTTKFDDVSEKNDWEYKYVKAAGDLCIISTEGKKNFEPKKNISRVETAKLVSQVFKAKENGTACEEGTTPPPPPEEKKPVTCTAPAVAVDTDADKIADKCKTPVTCKEGETAVDTDKDTVADACQKKDLTCKTDEVAVDSDKDGVLDKCEVKVVTPPATGTLEVSLNAGSPAARSVPYRASGIDLAKFDFTAASDDVIVKNVIVTRNGIGNDNEWANLYLYKGENRLTAGKSINSSNHAAQFNSVNITVKKGTTETLTLKGDVTATQANAGGESSFAIVAKEDVVIEGAGVSGNFPVSGNTVKTLSTVQAGQLTIALRGTLTNPKVGEKKVSIAQFSLTASGEDALLQSISLLVAGSITAGDVQNAVLYEGDTEVAKVDAVNSQDLLVFNLATPKVIEKGNVRNYTVKADLVTGRANDTLWVYLDEATDLKAKGGTYTEGVNVAMGGYDNGANDGTDSSRTTLVGGDVTISTSGPAAGRVSVNGKDLVLMNFTIASGTDVTFKNFPIRLVTTETGADTTRGFINSDDTSNSNFTDIKITSTTAGKAITLGPITGLSLTFANPVDYTTVVTEANDTTGYYSFTDEFSMKAGESIDFQLTVDIANEDELNGETILAYLELSGTRPELKDVNSKVLTNANSLVPTTAVEGRTMEIKTPTLTVAPASVVVSQQYVKGTRNLCFGAYTLEAGDASDVTLTDLVFTGYLDEDGDTYNDGNGATAEAGLDNNVRLNSLVQSLSLYEGDTQVGEKESVVLAGTATFNNLKYVIEAGTTRIVKVCGDVSTSAFVNNTNDRIAFGIAASAITAKDKSDNPVSQTGTANTTPDVVATIINGGTLTLSIDSSTPEEDIVYAGKADVEISKVKFTGTSEPFEVRKFTVANGYGATPSDWNNNIASIKVTYKNEKGETKTKVGSFNPAADSVYTFSFSTVDGGIYVPKDGNAIVTLSATLNGVNSGATAGEGVDLYPVLTEIDALAKGSNSVYRPWTMDDNTGGAGSIADEELRILDGSITFDDSRFINTVDYEMSAVADADLTGTDTLGGSASFHVNVGNADPNPLPIGTFICPTDDAHNADVSCSAATDDIYVVTAWTDTAVAHDLVTGILINDAGDASYAADTDVDYAVPGTQFFTSTKRIYIYENKPVVAISASSPKGSHSTSSVDDAFIFTITAQGQDQVQFRMGVNPSTSDEWDAVVDGAAANESDVSVTQFVSSPNSMRIKLNGDADDAWYFDNNVEMSSYTRASFWYYVTDSVTDDTIAGANISLAANNAADAAETATLALSTTTLLESQWVFVDGAFAPNASSEFIGLLFTGATGATEATDYIYIDQITLYNEKLQLAISSDSLKNTGVSGADGSEAVLKEGSTVVATGYVDITTNTSAAVLQFVPITRNLEIGAGDTKTYTVQINSANLITLESGADNLRFEFSPGTSSSAGTLYWNDTNTTVTWLGNVTASSVTGPNIEY